MGPPRQGLHPLIPEVVLRRGPLPESRHRVHMALVDARGTLLASSGDPDLHVFLRSAAKPFQALPLVDAGLVGGAAGLTPEELALCCGSHNGEEAHLEGVRRILTGSGLTEGDLECGPHPPMGEAAAAALARDGRGPTPIHNNCSGKHAGMLALSRVRGWSTEGYRRPDHPVQRWMLEEVSRWTGVPRDRIPLGVDGCGVPTFALSLRSAARAFAALEEAAGAGAEGPAQVVEAMAAHPFMVAGTGRLCTELMEQVGDRVVAKLGAEGVYGALLRGRAQGLVLKVEDGARRACEVALASMLRRLGIFTAEETDRLAGWLRRAVPNTRGEDVAWLEAVEDGPGGRREAPVPVPGTRAP